MRNSKTRTEPILEPIVELKKQKQKEPNNYRSAICSGAINEPNLAIVSHFPHGRSEFIPSTTIYYTNLERSSLRGIVSQYEA